MNDQENEQLEGRQGSAPSNQNTVNKPLEGDADGTQDENEGQEENWSDEDVMDDEENSELDLEKENLGGGEQDSDQDDWVEHEDDDLDGLDENQTTNSII